MRFIFWLLGFLAFMAGLIIVLDAKSAFQEVVGILLFVITSIFAVGAEIIAEIQNGHTNSEQKSKVESGV